MASAPSRPHLAPVMSILSLTMCLHAPSMIPVAMGQPFQRGGVVQVVVLVVQVAGAFVAPARSGPE